MDREIWRPLFCPICGAKVSVPVAPGKLPEVHRLPDHESANGMNVCTGLEVIVTLALGHCAKCGREMVKHGSGLCLKCFSEGGA